MRKAAVLVASLDRDVADALLEQMDDSQAELIRNAIMGISDVGPQEELAAIREFLGQQGQLQYREIPVETNVVGQHAIGSEAPSESTLDRASDRLIADCLCDELPQAIAVALSQLSTRRASEVVAHLPASVQTQVLERLVELEPTAILELNDVREEFKRWLNQQIERSIHRAEVAQRLATILDVTNSPTRERILDNVANSDARLAKELRHRVAGVIEH
ncbi:MAG: hypothetical protein P8N76_23435 [Pirellulaceae bacterium]|nr:hypothetical protein [Pirellulaceae bacterium]